MKPSKDPNADRLRNANISQPNDGVAPDPVAAGRDTVERMVNG